MLHQIVSILDVALGQSKQFANNEFYYFCPFCHHYKPKFAVNVDKRMWQCWKCGTRGGNLVVLLRRIGAPKDQIHQLRTLLQEYEPKQKSTDTPSLVLPFEYKPFHIPLKTLEYRHALHYVLQRGVTPFDILRYQIGFCDEGEFRGRIIVPSFDADGALNFFAGRAYYEPSSAPHKLPGVSKNVVGFEFHVNWDYPIVLIEGAFDAIAVKRNAIPLFGKTPSKKLQEKIIREGVSDVYLALDNDALKESLVMAERFMNQGINVYLVEMQGKDPSELGFMQTQHLIKNARKITFQILVALKLSLV